MTCGNVVYFACWCLCYLVLAEDCVLEEKNGIVFKLRGEDLLACASFSRKKLFSQMLMLA